MAGSKAAIPNMAAIKVPFPVGQSLRRRELCRLPHLRAVCAYVALPYSRYVEGARGGPKSNLHRFSDERSEGRSAPRGGMRTRTRRDR